MSHIVALRFMSVLLQCLCVFCIWAGSHFDVDWLYRIGQYGIWPTNAFGWVMFALILIERGS